ncbi:trimeric intracellular cation channel family protein [Xanthobacter sp. 126]|uniref:trimeric intracellular cation channel family protein n=1 Tax=Xanthobacter sp. 126 TaxID=1131814 RepID=UPI00056F382A|nr:trimeric intracellular cation channel family protein [Xanthobacter sp. 126]
MSSYVSPQTLLHILYLVAIVAEAMTAALAAGRREMDWVGVFLLGCVTALGGGSVRDVLLGNYPLSWVAHPSYLIVTGGAALGTVFLARVMDHLRQVFLFLDAVGLVVFTVIGCNVAIGLGLPVIVVIAAGMITGCVGGVLRDVLCNEVPLLFRAELYATVSILTGLLYVAGPLAGLPQPLTMAIAMAAGLTLRLLALRFGWSMPKFVYTKDLH